MIIKNRNYGKTYKVIYNYLLNLNFNINSIGFYFWIEAINIYRRDYYKYNFTIEEVYLEIAKRNNTSKNNVERQLRNARKNNINKLKKYFNYKTITNKRLLKLMGGEFIIWKKI